MSQKIFRNLLKNKSVFIINILGLGVALSFALLLSFYIHTEASVDSFHKNSKHVYRVLRDNTCAFSPPFAEYVKEHTPGVKAYTRVFEMETVLRHDENIVKTKDCLFVDSSFFSIFSFPLLSGSFNNMNDVLVSESFTKALFGHENPLGKTIRINDRINVTVSGVVEDFAENTHFKKPDVIFMFDLLTEFFGQNYLSQYDLPMFMPGLYVLVDENTDMKSKGGELFELTKSWYWLFQNKLNNTITFQPLRDAYFHPCEYGFPAGEREGNKTRLFIMAAIVVGILLIAAINYINLAVAQSIGRTREIGIKKILGIRKIDIIGQALSEAAIVCVISTIFAFLLILTIIPLYNDLTGYHIGLLQLINGDFLGLFLLLILLTILITGAFPAFVLSEFPSVSLIRNEVSYLNTSGVQKMLLVFQFFVSTALIISMIVVLKQNAYIQNFDLGFNTKETLYIPLNREFKTKMDTFKEEVKRLPGVDNISFCNGMPGVGIMPMVFDHQGVTYEFEHLEIDDNYFDVMGIEVGKQEFLNSSCWINRQAAQMLELSDGEFLKIKVDNNSISYKVNGLLPNLQFQPLYSAPKPAIFTKVNTEGWAEYAFIRFDSNELHNFIPRLKNVYAQFSSIFPFELYFLNETLDKAYDQEYRNTRIVIVFTVFTLLISSLGVFALTFYYCQSKLREIAIRKVHGATDKQIWLFIIKYFAKLMLVALAIACPIAGYSMNEWLSNFAFKVPLDYWIFVIAGFAVCAISLLVVTCQSLWAIRQNPVNILE